MSVLDIMLTTLLDILTVFVLLWAIASGLIAGWYEPLEPGNKIVKVILDYGVRVWILQMGLTEGIAVLWCMDAITISGHTATALAIGSLGGFALFLLSSWIAMAARAIGNFICWLSNYRLCFT